jgi:hypothetical protein
MAIDFEVEAGAISACVGFRQNSDAPKKIPPAERVHQEGIDFNSD